MKKLILILTAVCFMIGTFCACEPNVGEDGVAGGGVTEDLGTRENTYPEKNEPAGGTGAVVNEPDNSESVLDSGIADNPVDDGRMTEESTSPDESDTAANMPATDTSDTSGTIAAGMSAFGAEPGIAILANTANISVKNTRDDVNVVPASATDNRPVAWGYGPVRDSFGRPADAVKAQETYADYAACFLGKDPAAVYLTFDEGYENGYTARILDILAAKNARATFFVTYDYCRTSGDLVKRMIAEGHEVGNHSWTHPSLPRVSEQQARGEINKLHNYVKDNFSGYEMRLFRFPMGEFSERTLQIAGEEGYTSVFWSFAHRDWEIDKQPAPAESLQRVASTAHPGEILLLHAVSSANTEALPDIIDSLRAKGYRLSLFE